MTVPANERVAPVHDRMPLLIPLDRLDPWLDPAVAAAVVQPWLVPSPADAWRSWPISRTISDVKRDGPEIMAPLSQ
jgi:putative SOS response-associated peptidase YedK